MINLARVKRTMYFDSITLMKLARTLSSLEGIADAAAVMATPANLQLLTEAGLAPFSGLSGTPNSDDVLFVVRADDEQHALAALEAAETLLLHNSAPTVTNESTDGVNGAAAPPRSLEEARRAHPEANIAVISVPGEYAALEAQQALLAGLHVFLFSDNVSLADEVTLKRLATAHGLLLMGPDCGTALLNGVALGFANVVPAGPVGLIGASGTGMQQVMCLLAQAGRGISQAIGCGGRDLSAEVGGTTTLQALRLLQEDEQTRVIVLISKPPAPQVAERVLAALAQSNKPAVVIFLAHTPDISAVNQTNKIFFARTLTEAAQIADTLCTRGKRDLPALFLKQKEFFTTLDSIPLPKEPPYIAALFSGGTLCEEALYLWGERIGPVYSNISPRSDWSWRGEATPPGHYALDLGADEYTRGRPHPMIDPEVRLPYLRAAAGHAQVGVILLDIVLGYGAHPDPAALYAPFIRQSMQQAAQEGRHLHYVVSVCGTEDDPQCLSRQENRLREAGAETYLSNAAAAVSCLSLLNEIRA